MNVLLIVTGSIAAYKALELARLLRKRGHDIQPVLTKGGAEFISAISLGAICENKVRDDLFALEDEAKMSHIALARNADVIVVCPASANFIARLRLGLADDLASTLALVAACPMLVAPAMNPTMWLNPATLENVSVLKARGVQIIEPEQGETICGEVGLGHLAEIGSIVETIESIKHANDCTKDLEGLHFLITAGPTSEPIDPVRVITNLSSGKQGYAIGESLIEHGAKVTIVSGAVALDQPIGSQLIKVQTACEMADTVAAIDDVDCVICSAAVCDWRVKDIGVQKIKKTPNKMPQIEFVENPDILKTLCEREKRAPLIIGFAAETENIIENAKAKRLRKGCDWIVVNDVSSIDNTNKAIGSSTNQLILITKDKEIAFKRASKLESARYLVKHIKDFFGS